MSIVVFGLIAVAGARIWVVNQVDFSDNRNLIVAAVTLVLGAGNFSIQFGAFKLDGIGTATFGAIILYALLRIGMPTRDAEIGRASGRARVCQYVKISVVAVSFKKTN